MDNKQLEQDELYEFPYHYVPHRGQGNVCSHLYWNWGFCYLAGLDFVCELTKREMYNSLLDIGCGDGRFISELRRLDSKLELKGIDYSQRAINLARAMNPGLSYACVDICSEAAGEQWDVVTLIEVLEHIPPESSEEFISAVSRKLRNGGRLILTVPHINQPVTSKHYRHFDREALSSLLCKYFDDLEFLPFESDSKVWWLIHKLLGGDGGRFIITERHLLNFAYKIYCKHFLAASEHRCRRIACIARKKG